MKFGRKMKNVLALACAVVLTVGVLAGCGGDKAATTDGEKKVTMFMSFAASTPGLAENIQDSQFAKELQEKSGIQIEFIQPIGAGLAEQFNLICASEDMPDLVQYNWTAYPGGMGKAISDGTVIDLNEYKDKMPDLIKYLDEHPSTKAQVTTIDGQLPAAPFIRGDESLYTSNGVAIRKDWLAELGLELPETIDEWEVVLTAFKEKKGATAPLQIDMAAFKLGYFASGFDTIYNYYREGEEIKHGVLDAGFKDFLACMADWYEKGLLSSTWSTADSATKDANLLNGKTGAMNMSVGGGIGKYMTNATEEGFELTGALPVTSKKGTLGKFGNREAEITQITQGWTAATTSAVANIDATLELLNFGYTEEGGNIYNFGKEGESYNWVDGYPQYTELITNNPDGYAMSTMLGQYCCSYSGGPFVQDKRYMEQYGGRPQQREAWHNWEQSRMKDHNLPILSMYFTDEEQTEFKKLSADTTTYMDEIIQKIILGNLPVDAYDDMVTELKARGIERAIELQQNAYDRYLEALKSLS